MASQLVEGRGTSLQSPASALSNLQARAVHFLSNIRRQEEDKCKVSPNLCEKPAVSAQTTTWVVVGVVLGLLVVGTLSVMLFFHLKKKKREKQEDREDQFQMSDYGLDDNRPMSSSRARKTQAQPRLSFDDLPRPGPPPSRNPFSDDAGSQGPNAPNPSWPKRSDSNESIQTNLASQKEQQ